jgi:hypothetical protein
LAESAAEVVLVHVDEGDNVFLGIDRGLHVRSAATAHADEGDAEFRIRRLTSRDRGKADYGGSGGESGGFQETTAVWGGGIHASKVREGKGGREEKRGAAGARDDGRGGG